MFKNKIDKYLKKLESKSKSIYLLKIMYYIQHGGYIKEDDLDSLLEYIREINKNKEKTQKQYLVILYGPPGSGKTRAREIILDKICTTYNENSDQLKKSFIDTSIDDLVNIYSIKGITGEDALINKFDENLNKNCMDQVLALELYDKRKANIKIKEIANINLINCIKKNIKKFNSYDIYSKYRKNIDSLSELLFFLSVYIKKNIYMEISSCDITYIDKIIKSLHYYNYIPIVVYPFVSNANILYDRTINRSLDIGRVMECKGQFGIEEKMKICYNNFNKLLHLVKDLPNYIVLKYDSEIMVNNIIVLYVKKNGILMTTQMEYNKQITTNC